MARKSTTTAPTAPPVDFTSKTCEETSGMVGEHYIRCGLPADVLVKHRGRDEGPYFMCSPCGDHNIKNRNAEAIAVAEHVPNDFRVRWGIAPLPIQRSRKRETEMPDPGAIVRFYPNPLAVVRAYVESDFHLQLAGEHERKVKLIAEEGADVIDPQTFQRVGERLVDVATHRKDIEAWFKPLKDFAYRLHRMVCDREAGVLKPLIAFESTAKENAQTWKREDDRRRLEEEHRLAEEARVAEQERLAREAEQLEQRGEPELAAQVLEQAVNAPAPVITLQTRVPDVRGMSFRSNWKWRPVGGDTPQGRARAEKLVPREFLCLDERKLNAHAKAHGASARIPGIEFYDAGSVAVRT